MKDLLKDFDYSSFKKMKPPGDNTFDTMQEIKEIARIPMNKKFVQDKDDQQKTFEEVAKRKGIELPKALVDGLLDASAKVILDLKKHFNRPRPKVLAKKMNIKLDDYEMNSMKTPSYPSGHSAQGMFIGKVLANMYPKAAKDFLKAGKDISYSRNVAKAHYRSDSKMGEQLGSAMYDHVKSKQSPMKKRMGDFKHSDAPDAKGKFRTLSAPALASWMIKSRKGNLSKIISSLNQQVVFRRNKDPKYAAKMRRTMDIVRKRLGKKNERS